MQILIDGKEVEFSFTALFAINYKRIFKQDILKIAFPILKGLAPLSVLASESQEDVELNVMDLISLLPSVIDEMKDVEIVDIYKLLYASAATADKDLQKSEKGFETWLGGFNQFPLFDIVKELYPELLSSFSVSIESKKKLNQVIAKKK